ncbi:hypothetical protein GNI_113710 [Gregarina niphandrodes]|uniref:Uncharacterized protein n=1 Tax=Gregarina niphandrodes TaxID=110365 RepID=A0A023B3I3_GRENI|nr:hypothetical protein GNI_113710 [Gregarina niphandrodes]EZG55394.1 hypothetical protein GNI_113710 [Gregarina niphandrodes]|eukprot:XP_011131594.1 hypothetical protein GNI_113710 [Gregarina niphandrodes]
MDRPRSMDQPPKPIHVASRSLHPTIEPPLAQDLSGCKTPESFGESTNDTHWLPDPFKQHYVKVRGCSKGRLDLLLAKLHYFGFFVLDIRKQLRMGIGPTTFGLQDQRSATKLPKQSIVVVEIRRSKVYVRVHGGPTEKQRL